MSVDDFSSKMIYKDESGLSFSGMSSNENHFALTKSLNKLVKLPHAKLKKNKSK